MASERKAGVLLGYLLLGLKSAMGFVYVPLLLYFLGRAEYGLYQLLGSVVAYFTVMDMGLSATVVRYYARYLALGDRERMENLLAWASALYMVIGLLFTIICGVCYFHLGDIFSTLSAAELAEAEGMLLLLVLNLFLRLLGSVLDAPIMAAERFVFLKGADICYVILQVGITVLLITASPYALTVVVAQTFGTVLLFVAKLFYARSRLRTRVAFHGFDREMLYGMGMLSVSVFLVTLADLLYFNGGQVILGMYVGTEAVAVYAVAMQVVTVYIGLSTIISGIFLPKVTAMEASGAGAEEFSALLIRLGRLQFLLVGLVLSGFALFGQEFLLLWAGEGFEDAYFVALLFMAPFAIDLIQNINYSIMQAKNCYGYRAAIYGGFGVLMMAVLWLYGGAYGPVACALVIGAAKLVGELLLNVFYAVHLHLAVGRFWRNIGRQAVGLGLTVGVGVLLQLSLPEHGGAGLLCKCTAYSVVYALIMYRWFINAEERGYVKLVLRRLRIIFGLG